MDAIWLPEDRRSEAESAGYVIVDPPTIISTHITEIIKNHAAELLDRQAVSVILDTVKQKNPVLVNEVLETAKVPYGTIEKVFQNLLEEKSSPCYLQRAQAVREVCLTDCIIQFTKMMLDPESGRQ